MISATWHSGKEKNYRDNNKISGAQEWGGRGRYKQIAEAF